MLHYGPVLTERTKLTYWSAVMDVAAGNVKNVYMCRTVPGDMLSMSAPVASLSNIPEPLDPLMPMACGP